MTENQKLSKEGHVYVVVFKDLWGAEDPDLENPTKMICKYIH